jgi:hypothetical protein
MGIVVTLLAHGCPVQAIVAVLGFDERTVADWWGRSGRQGQAVHESLVEPPRGLGQVQADELRVKKQGGIVWMALAMMVKTRLWLGGEVSAQRDMPLIRRLSERVRRCAAHRPLLVCTDGVCSYIRAMRETLHDPVHTGQGGRPRLRPWRNVFIAQVVKRYERRREVATDRRMVDGTPVPGAGTPHPDAARRDVRGGHGLEFWHTAGECAPYAADDASHGRWDHRPWLDHGRTAVVSCAAASLGTTKAARASFMGTATLDRALVRVTTVKCGAAASRQFWEVLLPQSTDAPASGASHENQPGRRNGSFARRDLAVELP